MNHDQMTPAGQPAQPRAWLQALMLREPGRWSSRLGALMMWLKTLGRGRRRQFARVSAGVMAGASGIALMALLAGPMAPPVHAATINVDGTTCTLIDAIKAANTNTAQGGCTAGSAAGDGADTLVVTQNLYYDNSYSTTSNALPLITTKITIKNGIDPTPVFISRNSDSENDFRIFEVSATGDLTLDTMWVKYGKLRASDTKGGTVLVNEGGKLRVQFGDMFSSTVGTTNSKGGHIYAGPNTTVELYYASIEYGAAVQGGNIFSYGTVTSYGSQIEDGYAPLGGGGVFIKTKTGKPQASLEHIYDLLDSNRSAIGGGAIAAVDANVTIGGVCSTYDGALQCFGTYIERNQTGGFGGAIYLSGSAVYAVTISHTQIIDNQSLGGLGGAVAASGSGGQVTIQNTSFLSNTAAGSGGALFVNGSASLKPKVHALNTTFAGNAAFGGIGGAIAVGANGTLTTTHVTIAGNFAQSGGGLAVSAPDRRVAGSRATIEKSIISGNGAASSGHEIGGAATSSQSVLGQSANTNAASFVGGFTPSGTDRTATSDGTHPTAITGILDVTTIGDGNYYNSTNVFYLVDGSPAIDMITGPCLPAKDQAGQARPDETKCDAGAVEYYPYEEPVYAETFISTWAPGTIISGNQTLTYNQLDILAWDGEEWTKWFDGIDAGLNPDAYKPGSRWKHNINAMSISDVDDGDVYMSFTQNDEPVPDIPGRVDGMDVVFWDGEAGEWELIFKGNLRNIGLNNKTQEKIDGLHVLAAAPEWSEFAGDDCEAYMLISTQGPGLVPKPGNVKPKNVMKFGGEDVLGFCATNLGASTTGFWEMVLDGSAQGVVRNNIDSISMNDDETVMYVTSKRAFGVDEAFGGHSMVFAFDMRAKAVDGEFSGPYLRFVDDLGINSTVDALHVTGELETLE